jgi:hypothetical protein
MIVIKADNTNTHMPTIVKESIEFAVKYQCGVEVNINGKDVRLFPWDDEYDVIDAYQNGYYN